MRIEWLASKWLGLQEKKGPLSVGMEVKVSYKSGIFKGKIVSLKQGKNINLT